MAYVQLLAEEHYDLIGLYQTHALPQRVVVSLDLFFGVAGLKEG